MILTFGMKVVNVIQLAKILLLPSKYEIIIVPSNIAIAIKDFSLLILVKLSLLHPFLYQFSLLLFDGFLYKVIALPTIAIAIVVAPSRS